MCNSSFFAFPGAELRNIYQSGVGLSNYTFCGRQAVAPSDINYTPARKEYDLKTFWRLPSVHGVWPLITLSRDPVLKNGTVARSMCNTRPTLDNPQPCGNTWCGLSSVYRNGLFGRPMDHYGIPADPSTDSTWGVAYDVAGEPEPFYAGVSGVGLLGLGVTSLEHRMQWRMFGAPHLP